MVSRKYYGKQGELKGLNLELSLTEAKQIRSALSELEDEDLGNYAGILETLRKVIPQQWGE